MLIRAILLSSFVLGTTSMAATAAADTISGLKKPTSIGLKDGKKHIFTADDAMWPVENAERNGAVFAFSYQGSEYRLRVNDANSSVVVARPCMEGEYKTADANSKIGASQMGSGTDRCVKK